MAEEAALVPQAQAMDAAPVNILDPVHLFTQNQRLTNEFHQKSTDLALINSEFNRLEDDHIALIEKYKELKAEHKLMAAELENKSKGLSLAGIMSNPDFSPILNRIVDVGATVVTGIVEKKFGNSNESTPTFSSDPAANQQIIQVAELLAAQDQASFGKIRSLLIFFLNNPAQADSAYMAIVSNNTDQNK